ncbi:WD40-repeat-containing domain protein [Hyaloraphidium curvatum]|nr:WD40-repeat-containing domain protein [Hyaloraphidium curvatum]
MSAPHLLLSHPQTSLIHLLTVPGLTVHTSISSTTPAHCVSLPLPLPTATPPTLFAAQAARPTIHAYKFTHTNTLAEILKHPAPEKVTALASSPSGNYLVAGGATGRLWVWEVATGELLRSWEGHYKRVGVIRFSSCGQGVWTGGDEGAVHLWNLAELVSFRLTSDGPLKTLVTYSDHTLPVTDIDVTVGHLFNAWVVTASQDRTVRIRGVAPLSELPTILSLLLPSTPTRVILPPPYLALYIACSDGIVRRQQLYSRVPNQPGRLDPVTEYSTGRLDFSLLHKESKGAFQYPATPSPVLSLAMHGDTLYAGHADGTLTAFDAGSGAVLRRIDCAQLTPASRAADVDGKDAGIPKGVTELVVVGLPLRPAKRDPASKPLKRYPNMEPRDTVVEFPAPRAEAEPELELWYGDGAEEMDSDEVKRLGDEVERLKAREALLMEANDKLFQLAKGKIT